MQQLDLNADVGEGDPESDEALLRLVTSANVACGWHAGDADTMRLTVAIARRHGVAVGAHPGYDDREGFGRRPMQLSAVVLLFLVGIVLRNAWLSAAGVMAHIYSVGLAGWDEGEDLRERFGADWTAYRHGVRGWAPRFRPWHATNRPPARLFVAEGCGMCREAGRWFEHRGARHLAIVPAETHPSRALTRITYEPGDGSRGATGVEAVARALEHLHLGWALLGCLLRLPVICQAAQLLIDASGGEPRKIGVTYKQAAADCTDYTDGEA